MRSAGDAAAGSARLRPSDEPLGEHAGWAPRLAQVVLRMPALERLCVHQQGNPALDPPAPEAGGKLRVLRAAAARCGGRVLGLRLSLDAHSWDLPGRAREVHTLF